VQGGNNHSISGDAGNDKIYVSYGKSFYLDGGAGNDYIEVKGNNVQSGVITTETRNGTLYIGANVKINGGAGTDNIVVKAKNNYFIQGDAGNDTITVTGGSGHYIYGDNQDYATGNDKIILTNISTSHIYGGAGNDTITLNSGENNIINVGDGADTINIKGGKGNAINNDLGSSTVNLSGGSGSINSNSYGGNVKLYVDWSKPTDIGQFGTGGNSSILKNDTLFFKNTTKAAFVKDNFRRTGSTLTIDFDKQANGVGEIVISGWSDNESSCAFKGMITFIDKNNKVTGSLTHSEIKTFLG